MTKRVLYSLIISILFFFSCSQSPFFDMAKRSPDTMEGITPPKPKATSFVMKNTVNLSWDSHNLAKEYILYRDINIAGNFTDIVYKGTSLSFNDNPPILNKIYYYKLAIKFDTWESEKSNYVTGVATSLTKDPSEPNDTEKTPKEITVGYADSNLYYFTDDKEDTYEDKDFYCIKVSPASTVKLFISYKDNTNDENLLFIPSNGIRQVISSKNKSGYQLCNDSIDTTTDIVFSIVRNDNFKNKIIPYTIYVIDPSKNTIPSPTIESFKDKDMLKAVWINYPLTESMEFLLYKSSNPNEDTSNCVYQGKNYSYQDTDIESYKFYYYKIGIKFDDGKIVKSDYTGAVASPIIKDNYEPNNDNLKDNITSLSSGNIVANIQYFTDYDVVTDKSKATVKDDIDWYSVKLAAGENSTVKVRYLQSYGNPKLFFWQSGYTSPKEVSSLTGGTNFQLYNDTTSDKTIFFKIELDKQSNAMLEYQMDIFSPENVVVDKPTVESFKKSNTITLKWKEYSLAEKYVIYRSKSINSGFEAIAELDNVSGMELTYEDKVGYPTKEKGITTNTYYYYRMSIKFDTTWESNRSSDYGCGIATTLISDTKESNNDLSNATLIDSTTDVNIYYFNDGVIENGEYRNIFLDKDFYSVSVYGYSNTKVKVEFLDVNIASNDLLFNIYYNESAPETKSISSTNNEFNIYNTTSQTKNIKFEICRSSNFNNKIGSYRLIPNISTEVSVQKPTVTSFVDSGKIDVNWESYELADKYILYRDETTDFKAGSKTLQAIQLGKDSTSYVDTTVDISKMYYYKLAIIINVTQKESRSSEYSYGVRSSIVDNQSYDAKKVNFLETKEEGIYYFIDKKNNLLEDDDLYCVTLAPYRNVKATVDLLDGLVGNDLNFEVIGKYSLPISSLSGNVFNLYNDTDATKDVSFMIKRKDLNNKIGRYRLSIGSPEEVKLDSPKVESFNNLYTDGINIIWKTHSLAQSYVIYRDETSNFTSNYMKTINITDPTMTNYVDKTVEANKMYYYKVAIKFNNWESRSSSYGYGVVSSIIDVQNSSSIEVKQGSPITESIYYFNDMVGNTLTDSDSFFVKVAPNTNVKVSVTLAELSNNDLSFDAEDKPSLSISNGSIFDLYNDSLAEKNMYFTVLKNKLNNKIGQYTVKIESVVAVDLQKPVVKSLEDPNIIKLSWDAIQAVDNLAQNYVVYKYDSLDSSTPIKQYVFAKTVKSFDETVDINKMYYYRLGIKFGRETSLQSDYGYGVGSDIINKEDILSPTVIVNPAETITGESIFYFDDDRNNVLSDDDLYVVKNIPPYKNVEATITLDGLSDEDLKFSVTGKYELTIKNNDKFNIYNDSDTTKDINFVILKNKMKNKIGKYSMTLGSITNIVANKPVVESFGYDGRIKISWYNYGAWVQNYKLYRYTSILIDDSTPIYDGAYINEFFDDNVDSNKIYYYRLVITFNNYTSAKSNYQCGVKTKTGIFAGIVDDIFPSNYRVTTMSTINGVMYYYYDGVTTFSDTDSFCIKISPYKNIKATVSLQDSLLNEELKFGIDDKYSSYISNGNTFILYNDTATTKDVIFSVSKNTLSNKIGRYTINLGNEENDIVVDKPQVESFNATNTIKIKWSANNIADKYIVYRYDSSSDSDIGTGTLIYQGIDLECTDNIPLVENKIYYYRLAIMFNNSTNTSKLSDYTCGIKPSIADDQYTEYYRLTTSTTIVGTQYYFTDGTNTFSDIDSYRISISPYKNINVTMSLDENLIDGNLTFSVDGKYSKSISNGETFILYNDTNITKDISFVISKNNLNNKVGQYTMNVGNEANDIVVDKPQVESFVSNTVKIKWNTNNIADKYLVYRYDTLFDTAVGTLIYQGTDLECEDKNIPQTNKIYYYRLAIVFNYNTNLSKPSDYSCGIKPSIADDLYGEYYRLTTSTTIVGTQYYFTDGTNTFSDIDSYRIGVSPYKNVNITVSLDENLIDGDLNFTIDGKYSDFISNGKTFILYNETNSTKDISFVISRNNLNNKVGGYKITIDNEKDDIIVSSPQVESFVSNTVKIKWNTNNIADKYLVYRYDTSSDTAVGTLIYQGIDLECTDNIPLVENKIYYYRLAIKFNNNTNTSKVSNYSCGIKPSIADDQYSEYYRLTANTSITGTQYYFTDGTNIFSDTDSFCISVSPYKNVSGTISLLDGLTLSDLSLDVDSRYKLDISDGRKFNLYNDTANTKDIKFTVLKSFINNKVGRYTITLSNEADVIIDKPTVESYKVKNEVNIKWSTNTLAETYIVYRYDPAINGDVGTKIDEVTALNIIDNPPSIDKIYQYRLAIGFNSYQSKQSDYATGVKGVVAEDIEERNDTASTATLLTSAKLYSIYYCNDGVSNNSYQDIDWQYVTLGANEMQLLTINLNTVSLSNNIYYQQDGDVAKLIDNTTKSFWLYNNTAASVNTKFKIFTDKNISGYYSITTGTKKSMILQAPVVESYTATSGINISWNNLEIAEKYVLYRATSSTGTYTNIGEFTTQSYTDTGIVANTMYYYMVSSKFYVYETTKSSYGYGATSSITKDTYEPNETNTDAKELKTTGTTGTTETTGSIYYVKEGVNEIEDVDWYKVKLSARTFLQISIVNVEGLSNAYLDLYNGSTNSVLLGTSYPINNNTDAEAYIYFKISVNKLNMLNKSGKYMIVRGEMTGF